MSQHRNAIFSVVKKQNGNKWTRIHYAFCINVNSLRLFGARKSGRKPNDGDTRGVWEDVNVRALHVVWIFPEFSSLFCIRFVHAKWHRRKVTKNRQQILLHLSVVSRFPVHGRRPFRCSHIFFERIENTKRQTKNTQNNCETFFRDHFAESKHVQLAIRWRQSAFQPSADTILVRRVLVNCWLVHRLLPHFRLPSLVIDAFHYVCTRTCSLGCSMRYFFRRRSLVNAKVQSMWSRFVFRTILSNRSEFRTDKKNANK